MERDLLMLSQRLMLMLTTDTVLDTALLDMVTDHTDTQLMDIMERDLLMLSQRLMLLWIRSWIQHSWIWLQIIRIPSLWILERDPLMLSQRPMLTTDMVLDTVPLDTVTDHMDTQLMVLMDVSGDKLYATQLRSSKANNQNQWRSVPKK